MNRRLLPALLLTFFAATAPARLGIDAAHSKLTAQFRQMNVPVSGEFTGVTGEIVYDPAQPAEARAKIIVDTTRFDIGDADYNAEVRKKEWFDSAQYPRAAFVSQAIVPAGEGAFTATGALSLKGKTQAVSVAVKVQQQPTATVFSGELPLSRRFFSIGDPAWDEVVDDRVTVAFRIVQPH